MASESDCGVKNRPTPVISQPPEVQASDQHNLADDFKAIYRCGRNADFAVVAGDRHFPVHSLVLGARSSVFGKMFDYDTKEKESRRVEIKDFNADVVEAMLHFMYTDEAPNIGTLAEELLRAADKYDIPRLKAECQRQLIAALNDNNSAAMLNLSDIYKADQLKSASVQFIARNLKKVMQTDGWKSLNSELTQMLLAELANMVDDSPRRACKRGHHSGSDKKPRYANQEGHGSDSDW